MISEIPPFDVALGHELYRCCSSRSRTDGSRRKSLVVVTNGALGLLPLPLLPTEPTR